MAKINVVVEDVLTVSQFQTKSGEVGQSIWCRVPDNPQYSYSIDACTVKENNLQGKLTPGKSYLCEADQILRLVHVLFKDGSTKWINVPSYKVVKILEELS